MSDTPNRPAAPPAVVSDTHSRAAEGTGGPAPPGTLAESPTARLNVEPVAEVLPELREYRVVRMIGAGAMGTVYLAEDLRLGRKAAIKTMRPELAAHAEDRERFVREARAAAAVEHENIVPVWGIGETTDGTPYIAMPFLQGETLDARLRREPAPPWLLVKVACEVAAGLDAAHAAGLIHRDIKPANIWLEGDPANPDPAKQVRRAKLLDFGLARSVDQSDMQLTATGAVLGTPAYMSPEQARGQHVDARSDLFSLGATLYRMATGELPFEGSTPFAVLIAVTTDPPRPVRELAPYLPEPLADLVEWLMEKDAGARPQSAAEVVAAVRALAAPAPAEPPARPLPPAHEHPEPDPAPRWPLWALGAFLLALVPLGLWAAGAFDRRPTRQVVETQPGPERPKVDAPEVELPSAAPTTVERTTEKKPQPKPPGPQRVEPTPIAPMPSVPLAVPAVAPMPRPKVQPAPTPDRLAALFALATGGSVRIDDRERAITSAKELPDEPFRLVAASPGAAQVSDADLAVFAACGHLTQLDLSRTNVSDAGVERLKGCRTLTDVSLRGTRITSAALDHLTDCDRLQKLDVSSTKVDDAGLGRVKRFAKLRRLSLLGAPVTVAGVTDLSEALPECDIEWDGGVTRPAADSDWKAALWVLGAGGTVRVAGETAEVKAASALPKRPFKLTAVQLTKPTRDADLAAVAGCVELTAAGLAGTNVTDAGLAHFKDCKNLTDLDVSGTRTTDESVPVVRRFPKLTRLSLGAVPLSEKGLTEIGEALPKCDIRWVDRAAAEAVIAAGGTVRVSGSEKDVRAVADLPRAYRLRAVDLSENRQLTDATFAAFQGCRDVRTLRLTRARVGDAHLAAFKECKELTEIDLRGTRVSDAGLAHFKGCKGVRRLDVGSTKVGDAGAAAFAECKGLVSLELSWTQVTDAGLAHFKGCKGLERLQLAALQVSDAGLAHFKDAKGLKLLDLSYTRTGDAGLAHFKDCKGLNELRLTATRATDAGLAHFKDCKEFVLVALDRTKVGDAGLPHLAGCKNLNFLWLAHTPVTDAGLGYLKQYPALTNLHLEGTKVTAKGVADLQKALPKCLIKWDGPPKPEKK